MKLLTRVVIVAAVTAAGASAAVSPAAAAPAPPSTTAHAQTAVGHWVLWGYYRTHADCRAQGDYLLRHHSDKWMGRSCELNYPEPLTPYELWMLSR